MGFTMWIQMRLNPPPPDPTQAMIFNWMPVVFTFMLASFPAGLVIYWSWNNTLSVLQQYTIMRRQGVKPDIFGNMAATFSSKKRTEIAEREAAKVKADSAKAKSKSETEPKADEQKPAAKPARRRKRKGQKPTKPAGSEAGE
jgi:YidC/Oxa1 family membrane protein insertase